MLTCGIRRLGYIRAMSSNTMSWLLAASSTPVGPAPMITKLGLLQALLRDVRQRRGCRSARSPRPELVGADNLLEEHGVLDARDAEGVRDGADGGDEVVVLHLERVPGAGVGVLVALERRPAARRRWSCAPRPRPRTTPRRLVPLSQRSAMMGSTIERSSTAPWPRRGGGGVQEVVTRGDEDDVVRGGLVQGLDEGDGAPPGPQDDPLLPTPSVAGTGTPPRPRGPRSRTERRPARRRVFVAASARARGAPDGVAANGDARGATRRRWRP